MKSAKFLIAENPIVNDGRVFIIHNREPIIIAEAFHFEEAQEAEWMEVRRQFSIGATVDYPGELIALGATFCAPNDLSADKLAKIMSRMGDWYHNYLKTI
jgi:hypothetical protein